MLRKEDHDGSGDLFMSDNTLVLRHGDMTGEARSGTNRWSPPAYRNASPSQTSKIPPDMHFNNGGDYARHSEAAPRRKNPCNLL